MSFLDDIKAKKAGGKKSSGSSFLNSVQSKRIETEKKLQEQKSKPKEAPKPVPKSVPQQDFASLEAQSVQGVKVPQQKKVSIPILDTINEKLSDVYNPIEDKVYRFATSFMDSLALGQGKKALSQNKEQLPQPVQNALQAPQTTGDKVTDVIGNIAGMTLPIAGAYKTTGALGKKAFDAATKGKAFKGQKYARDAATGASAMLGYSTAKEALDEAVNPENKDLGERLKTIGTETALGAIGDPAARLLGAGIKKGAQAIKGAYDESLNNAPVSNFSAFAKQIPEKLFPPKQQNRVLDMIDVGGKQRTDRYTFDKFMTDTVDELRPLMKATKEIGGKDVPIEQNPYKQAWLSRGWKGKADAKLEYGILDDQGNKIAKSLKEVIQPIKGKLNEWREYAVALRSKEYVRDNLDSGIDPKLADEAIEKLGKDKAIVQATKDVRQYIDDMNQSTLVKSGVWSEDKLKQLRETHENYIPLNRTREKGIRDIPQSASNKRFGNQKDPTKKRTGSERPIIDPLESITKQTYKNTAIAEKNNVMKTLIELAEKNPDNAIVRPLKADKSILDSVQKSLDDFIMNPTDDLEKQLTDTLKLFEPQTVNGKKNVFTVMRNGKPEQWEVADDELAKVIGGLNNESVGWLAEIMGKPTGLLKSGLVLSLDFMSKNIVRDQFSAFINSKYGFIPLWDLMSGFSSVMKAEISRAFPNVKFKDDMYYKWLSSGGANGAWVSLERDYLQGQIRNLTNTGMARFSKNPLDALRKISEISEQSTRVGEFKKGLKKGAGLQESGLASRDVTLDFSRIGAKTRGANKAIAFFNVAVQSFDKMMRQFKERPVATTAKAVGSITIPSVILYAVNHDNPHYQELPQWERDSFWHIPYEDTFIRVPKPFEMGVIFGTFFERLMKQEWDDDPKAFEGFAKQVALGFTPSIIPTMFMPWIEAFANKDEFTGAPIVPKREENLLKPEQYGPYTSEVSKGLGRITNQSPRIIENTITGYTGTLGKDSLSGIDWLLELSGNVDRPAKPDLGLADWPIVKPFISKGLEGSTQSVDDFYKERDKLTKERTTAKKTGKPFEKEADYKRYNKINDKISDENANRREVLEDMKMTPEQKREELKKINLIITNLARSAKGLPPIK